MSEATTTSLQAFVSLKAKTEGHITAKGWHLHDDGWWRHTQFHGGLTGASLGMAASETIAWEARERELGGEA